MKRLRPRDVTGVVIRRSIAAAIALGALFTAIPATAQVDKTVTSGIWSAFAGSRDGTPICGVGAQLPDRSFTVSVQRDRPGLVRITAGTQGWDGEQVPRHTDISFEPNGELYGLTSAGSTGHFDYFDLDSAKVRAWVHDFTAGSKMILSFPDEAAWSFDLTGTSPTISAMLKCVTDYNMAGLPAPFALTAQPQLLPPSSATETNLADRGLTPDAKQGNTVRTRSSAAAGSTEKLLCNYTYTLCIGQDNMCGDSGNFFVTVDTAKSLVDGKPATIGQDYISWGTSNGVTQQGESNSINRKTGDYHMRSLLEHQVDSTHYGPYSKLFEAKGKCEVAPENKF